MVYNNEFLSAEWFGWLGTILAAIFFGSNYVVVKKFPVGDGIAYQWFMGLGILLTGYIAMFVSGFPNWEYSGLLGGSLWALGNVMVPTIIEYLGLGLAFLLWSIGNLLTGWFCGTFGLLGVDKEEVSSPTLNALGALVGIFSFFVYVFINPTLEDDKTDDPNGIFEAEEQESDNESNYLFKETKHESIKSIQIEDDTFAAKYKENKILYFIIKHRKRFLGIIMGISAGILYGINLIPFQRWYENPQTPEYSNSDGPNDHNPMMYVISQFSGIFLFSTFVMAVYTVVKKNRPVIYPETIFPAIISGMMWGIASACFMTSNGILGIRVSQPIIVVLPMVISSLWSVIVFKEIQGKRNLILLSIGILLNIASVLLTVLSVAT